MLCQLHTYRNRPPCLETTPLSPVAFLEHLQTTGLYEDQIVHVERLATRAASFGTLEHALCPQVRLAHSVPCTSLATCPAPLSTRKPLLCSRAPVVASCH